MSATRVNEVIARPVRTAIQAAPAWVITEFIDAWWKNGDAMNDRQFAVTVLLLTFLIGGIQTAIENGTGKGILRHVPNPPQKPEVPVVDNNNGGPR